MSATITTDGKYFIRARIMDSNHEALAAKIPGARKWMTGSGRNTMHVTGGYLFPLSMKTCQAFREVFEDELTVLPALVKWANTQVYGDPVKHKPQRCINCKRVLTKGRVERGKRTCHPCELKSRRNSRNRAHDRRVESEDFTADDYWDLYEAQNGHCAVYNCRAQGLSKSLAVEHDHKCDQGHDPKRWCRACVRGLTCAMHNEWFGRAGDDPEVFDDMAEYLRNPPARKILRQDG